MSIKPETIVGDKRSISQDDEENSPYWKQWTPWPKDHQSNYKQSS